MQPGTASSFSWQGKGLAFVPYAGFEQELAGFATGKEVRFRRPHDAGRAANPSRVDAARIPVEKIGAALLVVGGRDDQLWDSAGMAERIASARAAKGLKTELLIFEDAGHLLNGNGWNPTTQYNEKPGKVGGTPVGNARAQSITSAKVWEFLKSELASPAIGTETAQQSKQMVQ